MTALRCICTLRTIYPSNHYHHHPPLHSSVDSDDKTSTDANAMPRAKSRNIECGLQPEQQRFVGNDLLPEEILEDVEALSCDLANQLVLVVELSPIGDRLLVRGWLDLDGHAGANLLFLDDLR